MRVRIVFSSDKECCYNGRKNSESGNDHGICYSCPVKQTSGFCRTQSYSRNDGADIGFEKVRAHARHVAHIVADVVRYDCGVSGVVFRDSRFNFSDQVGTDVSGFCIDTAAHTGKESDTGSSERETEENVVIVCQNVNQRNAEKTESDNTHTHD